MEDFDDEKRISLHERLVKFYRAVDPDKLVKGIGEIVDFGLSEGEAMLNQVLRERYGLDLAELEEKEERRWSGVGKKIQSKSPEDVIRNEKFENLSSEEAVELAAKIEIFFLENDPEKVALGRESSYLQMIKYIDLRGQTALNKKLIAKYGKSLLDVSLGSKAEDVYRQTEDADLLSRLFKSGSSSMRTGSVDSFSDLRSTIKNQGSKSSKRSSVNAIELPDYVKPSLVSFYAKYEQGRLRDGSVKKVYQWARRNGLRKLNRELKRRYKQSLDEFVAFSDDLRTELVAFYTKIDPSKMEDDSLDRIHNWGVKNGRVALNKKFFKKYKFDLDTYKEKE